mgnify:FL=1
MAKEKRLHTALIASYSTHKNTSMKEFQMLNLTAGQPKVLTILSRKEGYLQKDLAKATHVQPATMSTLLSNMIEKDLVYKKRKSVSGGKRAFAIYLTDRGRLMAKEVNKIVDAMEEASFQGFDESEKEQLIDLLWRVHKNLSKE